MVLMECAECGCIDACGAIAECTRCRSSQVRRFSDRPTLQDRVDTLEAVVDVLCKKVARLEDRGAVIG